MMRLLSCWCYRCCCYCGCGWIRNVIKHDAAGSNKCGCGFSWCGFKWISVACIPWCFRGESRSTAFQIKHTHTVYAKIVSHSIWKKGSKCIERIAHFLDHWIRSQNVRKMWTKFVTKKWCNNTWQQNETFVTNEFMSDSMDFLALRTNSQMF